MYVGKRITYFRTAKGLTVNNLANLAGISQSYLRDVELGNKNLTVKTLSFVCDALGITLKEFFDEESKKELEEDPLLAKIYQLNPEQKNALLVFLETMCL